MPCIRAPPIHYGYRSGIGPFGGLLHGFDESHSYSKPFSLRTEGLYTISDSDFSHYEDSSPSSLSQWIGSTPLLSELEMYERVSQCPPPAISRSTHRYSNKYESYDEPLETHSVPSWSYDNVSPSGGSMYSSPSYMSDSRSHMHTLSPLISITSSDSPRSDSAVLSPRNEFSNVFDFDYGGSSLSTQSSWSPLSTSPSPSRSSIEPAESNPSRSREPSPVHNETEKQDRRRFPCLILGCSRRFTSQYTLKVHMEAHKPKPRVSFPCTEGCSERFSRQHDRLRHEVAKHGKVCEFSCDECGRFFSTKKTLGNHKCPVAQGSTRWVTS
jgi:hypothetical protein